MKEQAFTDQFVVTFLATWCATNHADYCARSLWRELAHPPVEDAQDLAAKAWKELQAHQTTRTYVSDLG